MAVLDELDCKFNRGQVVFNKKHGFRGVVIDVGASIFMNEDPNEIEERLPDLKQPWYCVLIDQSTQTTFVPEKDLEADLMGEPVIHPLVPQFFEDYTDGEYIRHYDA